MAIKKTTVASAVSVATKASKKAEPVSTPDVNDLEAVFKVQQPAPAADAPKKEYHNFLGKDRLIRTMPITWNPAFKGKDMKFVIYHDESCPPIRFGSLSDLEYLEKKYPLWDKWFISDSLCSNGRHRFIVYKIHILGVMDHVE